MGEISFNRNEENNFKGTVRVWAGVFGGVLLANVVTGSALWSGEDDPNIYPTKDLRKIEFIIDDLQCQGLSADGIEKVIASTVTCANIQE